MSASIASLFINNAVRGSYMNWTIDFKGGTEIYFEFVDKASHKPIDVDVGKVRDALAKAGEEVEVSTVNFTDHDPTTNKDVSVNGMIVRSPRFSSITPEKDEAAVKAFTDAFNKDRNIEKVQWVGEALHVRLTGCPPPPATGKAPPCLAKDKKPISNEEAAPILAKLGLELKPWRAEEVGQYLHPDEGTGDFNEVFQVRGLDKVFESILESALPNVQADVKQAYGVGAKAGDKLRNDAAKSIVFAIFLIMLYLAFRFDVRYAPGAAFATIHDAVMVIGVFAVMWEPVSLTSVAGLLTVMGYSVNDTVIVFDRIRENQAKLKDKKIERIIDISINEMLVRTILTSSTVFATTLIMHIFGVGLVANFAMAMNVGVIVGTYSSIFLAAPIFMYISRRWYSGPMPAKRRPAPVAASDKSSDDDE